MDVLRAEPSESILIFESGLALMRVPKVASASLGDTVRGDMRPRRLDDHPDSNVYEGGRMFSFLYDGHHDPVVVAGLTTVGISLPSLAVVNQWVAFGVGLAALALGLARLYYFLREKWGGRSGSDLAD